jgi:predicted nucleic acid-binding protein
MAIYCLDTNVLIQAWNGYYSMDIAPNYWERLDRLADKGKLFCTMEVKREIIRTDDGLAAWVKDRPHMFKEIDSEVQKHLRRIMKDYPTLVSVTKRRSIADPWVIAHAMAKEAIVVTKEEPKAKVTKIKIPHVCEYLDVPWINDFQMVKELRIKLA